MQNYNALGQDAPEWHIKSWIDKDGNPTNISLDSLKGKTIFILCFQSWCPGCHSSGFPTLQAIQKEFAQDKNVVLLAIQTVFEGFDSNTEDRIREEQLKYKLAIPFGHDPGKNRSTIMEDYHTGGTPWIIIIDKLGKVIYGDFRINVEEAIGLINKIK